MMANGSGSGRFSTPTSQESSIDLPHPNNQSSSSNSLEAMMTGRPSHPFYSPRLYPIPSHDVPYQQHSATQSTNTPIPIREDGSNPGGSSRTIDDDPPRSVSSGHDRNEGGNYRGGRNGYSYRGGRNGYSDRDDYRDKGKGRSRSGDRDNHAAPGSFSNRGDLYARRDSGWSDRSDRNSRDYRGGSKYDRR
ncbi:hypothetical protein K439DRAFT_865398 [Ramaria rubella]|nr:hypothetical protein K439DRAFT_865398 [Ramaria rubella]